VHKSADGSSHVEWIDTKTVIGLPFDSFIVGHHTDNVNTLRLWSARASRDFDLQLFNEGDYRRAVEEKVDIENISKVLYPPDHTDEGKELRLKQQYFFVACSLADVVRHFKLRHQSRPEFPEKVAIQLNDTHPAIAFAELMRIFLDEEHMPWEQAFALVEATCGYTNHTLMPEALERWPVSQRRFGRDRRAQRTARHRRADLGSGQVHHGLRVRLARGHGQRSESGTYQLCLGHRGRPCRWQTARYQRSGRLLRSGG
jgi:glucan phosphorylase